MGNHRFVAGQDREKAKFCIRRSENLIPGLPFDPGAEHPSGVPRGTAHPPQYFPLSLEFHGAFPRARRPKKVQTVSTKKTVFLSAAKRRRS